jgi:choline dehydrogenase-like flavoprotein
MSVVVIGSGPTGAAAAWQLMAHGIPVVMLEAGSGPLSGLQMRIGGRDIVRTHVPGDWMCRQYPPFENLGDPQARWVQLEACGGLSNVWGGVVLRCASDDFAPPADGDERHQWPIGYRELVSWYAKVERLLWIRGSQIDVPTLPSSAVRETIKLDPVTEPLRKAASSQGRFLVPLPYVDGPPNRLLPCASPRQIVWPLLQRMRRRGLRLICRATVTRLHVHPHQNRVEAIEYLDNNQNLRRIEADAVFLAAGSLASPRLLLNSACSLFPDGLGNRQGLVGRYLHDNPLCYINTVVDRPLPFYDGSSGGMYLTRRIDERGKRPCGFQIYSGWAAQFHPNLRGALRDNRADPSHAQEGFAMVFSCYSTQTPTENLGLRLHPLARDCHGIPLLQLDARFGEAERRALQEGVDSVRDLLTATGWEHEITTMETLPPGASVHWGGAVRMHSDPRYGVLDSFNRCHDLPNLLVVDASCFTGCVEKNPTLTAMALAMRAADAFARSPKAARG